MYVDVYVEVYNTVDGKKIPKRNCYCYVRFSPQDEPAMKQNPAVLCDDITDVRGHI